MAVLTWRNVDAPDFRSSMEALKLSTGLLGNGLSGIKNAVNEFDGEIGSAANKAIQMRLAQMGTSAEVDAARKDGGFMNGVDPRYLTSETINAPDARYNSLLGKETALAETRWDNRNRPQQLAEEEARRGVTPSLQGYDQVLRTRDQKQIAAYEAANPQLRNPNLSFADTTSLIDMRNTTQRTALNENLAATDRSRSDLGYTEGRDGIELAYKARTTAFDLPSVIAKINASDRSPAVKEAAIRQAKTFTYDTSAYAGMPSSMGGGSIGPEPMGAAIGTAPKGERNKNLGNLEDGPFARSQPGYKGSDGRFAIFDTPENGNAAQQRLLSRAYIDKGFNTPFKIVDRYAGADAKDGENSAASVRNYKSYIARKLGIGVNDVVPQDKVPQLAQAMREFENGGQTSGGGGRSIAAGPYRGDSADMVATKSEAINVGVRNRYAVLNPNGVSMEYGAASADSRVPSVAAAELIKTVPAFAGQPASYVAEEINKVYETLIKDKVKGASYGVAALILKNSTTSSRGSRFWNAPYLAGTEGSYIDQTKVTAEINKVKSGSLEKAKLASATLARETQKKATVDRNYKLAYDRFEQAQRTKINLNNPNIDLSGVQRDLETAAKIRDDLYKQQISENRITEFNRPEGKKPETRTPRSAPAPRAATMIAAAAKPKPRPPTEDLRANWLR